MASRDLSGWEIVFKYDIPSICHEPYTAPETVVAMGSSVSNAVNDLTHRGGLSVKVSAQLGHNKDEEGEVAGYNFTVGMSRVDQKNCSASDLE